MIDVQVSDVVFHAMPEEFERRDLLGWTSFSMNQLVTVQNVQVRRGTDGKLSLRYPATKHDCGARIQFVAPFDDEIRQAIELQVFGALALEPAS